MDKKMLLINILVSCAISAGSIFAYHHYFGDQQFVTVDLEGIIEAQKNSYRERLMMAKTPEEMAALHNESVVFVNSLYESVQAYSHANHVAVFQSKAMIAGESKDITKQVAEAYGKELGK